MAAMYRYGSPCARQKTLLHYLRCLSRRGVARYLHLQPRSFVSFVLTTVNSRRRATPFLNTFCNTSSLIGCDESATQADMGVGSKESTAHLRSQTYFDIYSRFRFATCDCACSCV
jgi:hypothetical protein